jgi:hypothetical protein
VASEDVRESLLCQQEQGASGWRALDFNPVSSIFDLIYR